MEAQGYTWDELKSCTITATTPEFADHVASIPQGAGEGNTQCPSPGSAKPSTWN